MPHRVYTTETFDREFKKKHGDKNNLLESIIAKLERCLSRASLSEAGFMASGSFALGLSESGTK